MHSRRFIYAAIFLICAGLLGFGLYLEFVSGLEPCPLCMVQRVFFVLIGACALVAAMHGPQKWGIRIYSSFMLLCATLGALVAGRQVWLQHLPPEQVPECGPGLAFMLEVYPLTEALLKVLEGSGDCAEVVWRFLGRSIPEWSLLMFLVIAATGVTQIALSGRVKKTATA